MIFRRREFLKTTGLATAAGLIPGAFFDVFHPDENTTDTQTKSFVIKDAYILSMDENIGDISKGSIVVEHGEITEVGQEVAFPEGMEIIDGEDQIVMPGLIDSHWHLWTSLLKSMAGNSSENGYFPLTTRYSRLYTPAEMELATRYAAAEAISAGITTVADYNHNAQTPDYVLAGCKALADYGMRAQVLYGTYRDMGESDPTPFEGIEQVLNELKQDKKYDLLSLGLGSRGPDYPQLRRDWERARDLGMRISIHAAQTPDKQGQIQKLADLGLLGSDVNIIHANYISPGEIREMAAADCTVTMTPYTEMRIGFGAPKVNQLYEGGVNLALGVDSTALTGSASLFENMKLIQNISNAEARDEFFMPPYEVLKMATINGARALGIDKITGSISPGKRADLIMLSRNDLNLSVGKQVRHLVVEAARPHNVSFVVIDGKIVKRSGRPVHFDLQDLIRESREALNRMSLK